ncbi:palmitoyltransferase ZDHHC23-like isoform X1 [Lytechinus pictus]|uniref:palmitoyltransferase ZDHHC23-like isoform X1 n=2 Tax=Lytechinus pictus TaxID=7653 RepID=UPI0030B9F823
MDKKDEIGDPLCCCEYIDAKGERSHLLAMFCDCEDLDESCDRLFTGRTIGRARLASVKETILDRVRIPTFLGQGAQRIDDLLDMSALLPLIAIPCWLYVASWCLEYTVYSFMIVPLSAILYSLRILRRKQRTKFFMSVTLVSIFTLFSSFVILVTDATVIELACVSMNLLLFFGAFASTKVAPGFVKCRQESSGTSCQRDEEETKGQASSRLTHLHKSNERGPPIGQNKEKEEQLTNQMQGSSDWCAACLIVKPARAGHCKICDRCVHRLDHHCVWLDVCIGRDNHRSFIVTLILFVVGGFWGVLRGSYYLFEVTHDEASFYGILEIIYYDPELAIIFVCILYGAVVCPAVMALLLKQCFLITHNWTYRERKLLPRQPGGKERLLELDHGFVNNWINFITKKGDMYGTGDTCTRVV